MIQLNLGKTNHIRHEERLITDDNNRGREGDTLGRQAGRGNRSIFPGVCGWLYFFGKFLRLKGTKAGLKISMIDYNC